MSSVKSAFEILMNRTNRIKEVKTTVLPAEKTTITTTAATGNKSEPIVLNDSFTVHKEPLICTPTPSASLTNINSSSTPDPPIETPFDPIFLCHVKQYTDQDLKLIEELQTAQPRFKFKQEVIVPDVESIIKSGSSLEFDFTRSSSSSLRPCDCNLSNPTSTTEFEKITFSLNNSLDSIAILDAFKSPEKVVRSSASFTQIDLAINRPELMPLSKDPVEIVSPSQDRYAKRRKTELIADIKPVSPVKRRTRGRPRKQDPIVERVIEEEPIELLIKQDVQPVKPETSSNEDLLWTEKYQFKNENDIVTNNSQIERLKEWLTNWKNILSKDSSSQSGKSKSWNTYSDSEDADYSCESDSDASSVASGRARGKKFYPNAIMLTGPHGCGKTSSVYSIAKQLGFKIFEVNASSLRCKSQIIQELEGAINSHHVSNNNNFGSSSSIKNYTKSPVIQQQIKVEKKPITPPTVNKKKESMANSIRDFFRKSVQPKKTETQSQDSPVEITGPEDNESDSESSSKPKSKKRKNSLRRETVLSAHQKSSTSREDQATNETTPLPSTPTSSPSVKIHTESLILFDEIDVVFKEDVGFFAAINHFIKKSRKPIVLTTNDEFILTQAKTQVNLNVEKIRFNQPRVDAGVKFLKSVANSEKFDLDTSVAYKILNDCKCDMRRALVQLQTVIGSSRSHDKNLIDLYQQTAANSILNMYQSKNKHFFSKCDYHNEDQFFSGLFYLDTLTKKLGQLYQLDCPSSSNYSVDLSAYDACVIKDGLSDASSLISTSSSWSSSGSASTGVFNPFQSQAVESQYSKCKSVYVLSKHNTTYLKEELLDLYTSFVILFNDYKPVEFSDWVKYGRVAKPGFAASSALNRFAQNTFKFTSSPSLYLDYRPFLQEMCSLEESRQLGGGGRRRFLHHLNSTGLSKDDLALLAKSSLVDEEVEILSPASQDSEQAHAKDYFTVFEA